jgi:UDP-glucose 4-epimerase
LLREETPAEPESLYAITKFASERVAARLGSLWQLDVVSVRLSAVFGRWERATGVRDTLSPQAQMVEAARSGRPAVLSRPGARDWIYATDVGEAVLALAMRREPCGPLYNITTGQRWSALAWGEAFARHNPGISCRLAEPGETPTIDLHSAIDRPSMCDARMRQEIGWRARYGLEDSARDLAAWTRHQAKALA